MELDRVSLKFFWGRTRVTCIRREITGKYPVGQREYKWESLPLQSKKAGAQGRFGYERILDNAGGIIDHFC